MGLGLAVGLSIFERASHELLRRVFGVFVVTLAAIEALASRARERGVP
jgi:hypothetical protein